MRRCRLLSLGCWVLVMVAACGPAIPSVPAPGGGSAWLEVTSPHFTLWTDASPDRAREAVVEMEHLRQVIIGSSFRSVASEGSIFAIALRDLSEFHTYFSDQVLAFAMPAEGNLLRQPVIVVVADTQNGEEQLLEAHELTHAISYAMIARQPRWFAEGLAQFFETIRLDVHDGTAELGRAPEHNGQPMQMHHLIGLPTMFDCEELSCADEGFYVTAWAVFTYLQNTHAAELARFEQLLAARKDWQPAWSEAFPRLPVMVLEDELRVWLTSGRHRVLRFTVKFQDPPVSAHALGEANVHMIRALLAGNKPAGEDARAAKRREVETALRIDPTSVLANLVSVELDNKPTREAARAVAAAHGDDWRAWWLLALVIESGDEAMAAARRACQLAAANPAVVPPAGLCRASSEEADR